MPNTFDTKLVRKQGSTLSAAYVVQDEDGNTSTENISGWSVEVNVRQYADSAIADVSVSTAAGTVTIDNTAKIITVGPSTTVTLDPGKYVYDIKITKASGEIYLTETFAFVVPQPVTRA